MPKFNRSQHNPTPAYIRGLVARIGLSQRLLAEELDVTARTIRYWVADGGLPIPYVYQFALECLSRSSSKQDNNLPQSKKATQEP